MAPRRSHRCALRPLQRSTPPNKHPVLGSYDGRRRGVALPSMGEGVGIEIGSRELGRLAGAPRDPSSSTSQGAPGSDQESCLRTVGGIP